MLIWYNELLTNKKKKGVYVMIDNPVKIITIEDVM
jgi:hypothetical protein